MRRVQQIMGMPISLDIPGEAPNHLFDAFFELFKKYDAQFSPFKPTSEVSRLARGNLSSKQISSEMRQVLKLNKKFKQLTHGFFSANYAGRFEPSGLVKGWAVQQAGDWLGQSGIDTFLINAGGDILARSQGGRKWRIALQHPVSKQAVFGTVEAYNIAVATSGSYERGAHIINPHTGASTDELLSITVIGPELIMADVLATAAFAMGAAGLGFIKKHAPYQAITVNKELNVATTGDLKGKLFANNSLLG